MEDNDFMELGNTGWIPIKNGWLMNPREQKVMDPEGNIHDAELIEGIDFDYDS